MKRSKQPAESPPLWPAWISVKCEVERAQSEKVSLVELEKGSCICDGCFSWSILSAISADLPGLYSLFKSEEPMLYCWTYNAPLPRVEFSPRSNYGFNIRALRGVLVPALLNKPPYFWGKTAVFGALRLLWSLSAGNHKNGRFVSHIAEWQTSREDLDVQHRKREDIG
jgi:hypothetical protein